MKTKNSKGFYVTCKIKPYLNLFLFICLSNETNWHFTSNEVYVKDGKCKSNKYVMLVCEQYWEYLSSLNLLFYLECTFGTS